MSATHDLSSRSWGCDYAYRPLERGGGRAEISGWHSPLPEEGDYLILAHPLGGTTRYQVESVRAPGDPPDQFFATVRYAPR